MRIETRNTGNQWNVWRERERERERERACIEYIVFPAERRKWKPRSEIYSSLWNVKISNLHFTCTVYIYHLVPLSFGKRTRLLNLGITFGSIFATLYTKDIDRHTN